jgi:hypothetical protein
VIGLVWLETSVEPYHLEQRFADVGKGSGGAVHGPGHHRSAGSKAGSLRGLDGDFSLNAVSFQDLGKLRWFHSAGGA